MTLAECQEECDAVLTQLETLFQPHCKLTLIMRNPKSNDGDMILSRDDLREVEKAIKRLRLKENQ